MKTKKRVYECKIGDADETGIYAMSFVDYPANESNFVALSKQARAPQKLAVNKQKQILTGVVLKPEQVIYRYDEERGEYYIKFSATDIERIAQKMMKTGVALYSTTHQHEKPLSGNYLVELWIVQDPKRDKAVALGLGELPQGTLVASYKVTSAKYWRDEVLTGKVKGFSLEGFFNLYKLDLSMNKNKKKPAQTKAGASNKGTLATKLAKALGGVFEAFLEEVDTEAQTDALADVATDDETNSGTPYLIFPLAEGGEVWVDDQGFATLEGGESVPEGEHPLADGNVIVIDADGKMVTTEDEASADDPVVPETELKKARQRGAAYLKAIGKTDVEKENERLREENAKLKGQPRRKKVEQKADAKDGEFKNGISQVLASRRAAK